MKYSSACSVYWLEHGLSYHGKEKDCSETGGEEDTCTYEEVTNGLMISTFSPRQVPLR
jgi:hypothetical protein